MRDLIRWAKAVADGDPLEPARPDDADDPERARVLQQLQIVAEIARLHRNSSLSSESDPQAESASSAHSANAHVARAASAASHPGDPSGSAAAGSAASPSRANDDFSRESWGEPGTWGHLTLQARIGGGSFGVVYRAWDARLDRAVALKLLYREEPVEPEPPAGGATRTPVDRRETQAIAEGRLLARLRHRTWYRSTAPIAKTDAPASGWS